MSTRSSLFFTLSVALHAATVTLDSRTAIAQSQPADDSGDSGFVRMRPIDRATVRIFALRGMAMEIHRNERTGRDRAVAVAQAGHGTGVVVDPDGFIVTAAHVVSDAQQIAVVMPGGNEGYPADVVFTDPAHDVAILRAGRTFQHYVALPTQQPTVQLGDHVGITGYPLTPSERMPAAASGEISRLTNDGRIQLAASINPGNSGGPVVDGQGALVGVVSSRLLPQEGAQGIAFIEPIAPAIRAFRDNVRRSRALEGNLNVRKDLAQVVVATLRMIALGLSPDEVVLNRLVTAIDNSNDTDSMALFAGYLWNGITGALEASNVDTIRELPAQEQRAAAVRFGLALGIARRAVSIDRSITRRYQIVQDIIEIGEGVERNARATPGEQRTATGARAQRNARSGANGAHDSEGRYIAATPVHTTPRDESAETSARFARTSVEFGGGMALDFSTAAPNGGGFFVSATHDVLRWEPARWAAITFASVGGGVHGAFSANAQTYSFHADIGMRVRLGSAHGSSFSVSGHYTPGALLGVTPATQSAAAQAEGAAMYLGLRVDAALHFNSYFALSVRYTDQYRPAMINGLRMVSLGLAWTF
ncbi:MAG: serine protease [Polyangiales bacterium]